MAKTLMSSRPYSLLRQALPSSLLQLPKRHFVSPSAVLLNKTETNLLFSCKSTTAANNRTKLHIVKLGFGAAGNRRFNTRATHINDAGSIDSPLMQSMEKKVIKEELNAESVTVKDAYGDGRHVSVGVSDGLGMALCKLCKQRQKSNGKMLAAKSRVQRGCIDVISVAFEGQSAVNRQRMVYKAIWEELQSTVHAVDQMTTRTPTEAAGQK
ncbi:unnamed protein product [Dovyalis caffra]|uniref:Uncharacterized protein n=1 Tax=Dovyalis caffra TaxID=77055 RepID=A0AAV1REM7_9ROSI|nr:unnamed protein product [Dovyalis caffra]